jgi:hypothetical protein
MTRTQPDDEENDTMITTTLPQIRCGRCCAPHEPTGVVQTSAGWRCRVCQHRLPPGARHALNVLFDAAGEPLTLAQLAAEVTSECRHAPPRAIIATAVAEMVRRDLVKPAEQPGSELRWRVIIAPDSDYVSVGHCCDAKVCHDCPDNDAACDHFRCCDCGTPMHPDWRQFRCPRSTGTH